MEQPTGSGSTPPLPFLCDWMWNKIPWICNCQKKGKLFTGSAVALTAILLLITAADVFICGSFSKGRFFFVTIQYKNSSSVTSHTACTLLNLTVISFFLTDAFNIISLDSITNYYRLVNGLHPDKVRYCISQQQEKADWSMLWHLTPLNQYSCRLVFH